MSAVSALVSEAAGLPDEFPEQTRYVIEGEDAGGAVRIVARYLVYPDGTRIDLVVEGRACSPANASRRVRVGSPLSHSVRFQAVKKSATGAWQPSPSRVPG